jgi:hypothetical protein
MLTGKSADSTNLPSSVSQAAVADIFAFPYTSIFDLGLYYLHLDYESARASGEAKPILVNSVPIRGKTFFVTSW